MGCYTHVNKRLKYTREELLVYAKAEIEYREQHKRKYDYDWELREKFDSGNRETEDEMILAYFNRLAESAEHGYADIDGYTVSVVTGLLYTSQSSGIFRIRHYPENECHSLRETLDFLAETQRAGIYIEEHENTMPYLEEFWKKNPDGMINFY